MALLLASVAAHASEAQPSRFAGTWALKARGRNAMVFRLHLRASSSVYAGDVTSVRYLAFEAGGGALFDVRGPTKTRPITSSKLDGSALYFSTKGEAREAGNMVKLVLTGPATADLSFVGLTMNPLPLVRVRRGATVATNWRREDSYAIGPVAKTNPVMTAIYDADQSERANASVSSKAMTDHDSDRRIRTREIIARGGLSSGLDYEHAAFIFQHGSSPEDYLLAHTLSIIALKKGQPDAATIASESLDRYLQAVHAPQIYGTQFRKDSGTGKWTQEPFEPEVISDSLRRELGVQMVQVQKEQLARFSNSATGLGGELTKPVPQQGGPPSN